MTVFYLGTHHPNWLWTAPDKAFPLFVSHVRLKNHKSLRPALGRWALDSGGFSEISKRGRWTVTAGEYVAKVRHYVQTVGRMDFAAIQDWMCEPHMVKKTGLSIREHQTRTVASFLELSSIAPEVSWLPVLQGWEVDDYMRHVDEYAAAGVDLTGAARVGVGSVCRRQATSGGAFIFEMLAARGLSLHGFGVKTSGMGSTHRHLASADSMAWSMMARRSPPLPGHKHKSCANCLDYALMYRDKIEAQLKGLSKCKTHQPSLPLFS